MQTTTRQVLSGRGYILPCILTSANALNHIMFETKGGKKSTDYANKPKVS